MSSHTCGAQIFEEAALHEHYTRVISTEPALNEETEDVCALLKECADLRCCGVGLRMATPCTYVEFGVQDLFGTNN